MFRYSVSFTARDLPGFLDMLRYEQATVIEWDHSQPPAPPASATLGPSGKRPETWTVRLQSPAPPVMDRWASFLLFPRNVQPV